MTTRSIHGGTNYHFCYDPAQYAVVKFICYFFAIFPLRHVQK